MIRKRNRRDLGTHRDSVNPSGQTPAPISLPDLCPHLPVSKVWGLARVTQMMAEEDSWGWTSEARGLGLVGGPQRPPDYNLGQQKEGGWNPGGGLLQTLLTPITFIP